MVTGPPHLVHFVNNDHIAIWATTGVYIYIHEVGIYFFVFIQVGVHLLHVGLWPESRHGSQQLGFTVNALG